MRSGLQGPAEAEGTTPSPTVRWFFPVFFLSGACALVYQVVWLRLAMAAYGVTAPMVAIVLSIFMGGIALGSLLAGAAARRGARAPVSLPLRIYALVELVIALSGVAVQQWMGHGLTLGARLGAEGEWASLSHYAVAGSWVALLLLPATTAMGATVPLALWAIRRAAAPGVSERGFSYLYLANTLGALAGTLLSSFVLIELLGFEGTSRLAVSGNALLAAVALALSIRARSRQPDSASSPEGEGSDRPQRARRVPYAAALLVSGFSALGMEVLWNRLFTSFLGTEIYTFALILAVYLGGTAAGAAIHRRTSRGLRAVPEPRPALWAALAVSALLPLLAADPRLGAVENPRLLLPADFALGALRVALGILPFCLIAGYLTPRLVDAGSKGDPETAGRAYAINLLGCLVGPLAVGFVLLPRIEERTTLVLLALPLLALGLVRSSRGAALRRFSLSALAIVAIWNGTRDQIPRDGPQRIRRDYAATSIALGRGMERRLLVNGFGMTRLTPVTKMMAHLPVALLDHPPRSALVICFGMGTTFRSLASWQIDTTAVELVPGVAALFDYFHEDADEVLRSPAGARIVIDDGRRFLDRVDRSFDVITIDPPPPVSAAGSSLLYSSEFYERARRRLAPGGILQQWLPGGDPVVVASITRALVESFPHVRAFGSIESWGIHYLASDHPIELPSRDELLRRFPRSAEVDLLEWTPKASVASLFGRAFSRELSLEGLLASAPTAPALEDDRPYNEYFLLRALAASGRETP